MVCQGLKDGALDWFTSYLSDKSQSVRTAAAAVYIIQ